MDEPASSNPHPERASVINNAVLEIIAFILHCSIDTSRRLKVGRVPNGIQFFHIRVMKKIVQLSIALLFTLGACKEISFREPQPKGKKNLDVVPSSLRGRYLAPKENGETAMDTIIIDEHGYRFGYYDKSEPAGINDEDEGRISDSLVLRHYKGHYFLSQNNHPEWILRIIRREKNGDLIYMAPGQQGVDFKDYLKKISREIKVDSSVMNDKTIYQIDPSPTELLELIQKGYFQRTVLKKIKTKN